jgi:hypothetical protein
MTPTYLSVIHIHFEFDGEEGMALFVQKRSRRRRKGEADIETTKTTRRDR